MCRRRARARRTSQARGCRKPANEQGRGLATTVAAFTAGGMRMSNKTVTIAVLDDYQNVALRVADWSVLDGRAAVTVFNDHLADTDAAVERLKGFDVLCVMRERTPL